MILAAVLMLASCAKKYKIEGSSAISELDGKKISVKVIKDDSLATVATGTMAHGKFTVKGQIDSATMANLFIGEDIVIPIVLEEGEISVDLKAELSKKLQEFASTNDNLDEIFENREQIEISRFYEKLPKPSLIATQEFRDGKIYYRNPSKETQDDLL